MAKKESKGHEASASGATPGPSTSDLADVVGRAATSVVRVQCGGRVASGIVIGDGEVVTTAQAALDDTPIEVYLDDERRSAALIGRDLGTDVALLSLESGLGVAATVRAHDDLRAGDVMLALGRPGKVIRASLRILGAVAGPVGLAGGARLDAYLESDRSLPRGFAGGPLVDTSGRCVGMNSRAAMRGADLAVPMATLDRVTALLREHGSLKRGYLGVGAYSARLPGEVGQDRGALVLALEPGSPAERGGLLLGDTILTLGGRTVRGPRSLRDALSDRPSTRVEVKVLRAGKTATFELETGERAA
jgi:S1-C subfamily serine protease